MENNSIDFDKWMQIGIENGWCGPPVCYLHDGLPLTPEEEETMYDGTEEYCIHIVRMYDSEETAKKVVENHSPSQWRDHYTIRHQHH